MHFNNFLLSTSPPTSRYSSLEQAARLAPDLLNTLESIRVIVCVSHSRESCKFLSKNVAPARVTPTTELCIPSNGSVQLKGFYYTAPSIAHLFTTFNHHLTRRLARNQNPKLTLVHPSSNQATTSFQTTGLQLSYTASLGTPETSQNRTMRIPQHTDNLSIKH